LSGAGQSPGAGSYVHSNEPSGSIRGGNFLTNFVHNDSSTWHLLIEINVDYQRDNSGLLPCFESINSLSEISRYGMIVGTDRLTLDTAFPLD
jgi:hypothetical protein